MSGYQDVHWASVNFLKNHLYRRIASPLNAALGRLAIAQHLGDSELAQEQFRQVEQNLEVTLNLIKAWAALIHVQSGGTIHDQQRRQIGPDNLPQWLVDHLKSKTRVRLEHTQWALVHPETFYESLILICEIGAGVGRLKHLTLADARGMRPGIWIRAVFQAPPSGPYASLNDLLAQLNAENPAEFDTAVQLQVLGGFLKINHMRFMLQNNIQSGEQALTALLPAVPRPVAGAAPGLVEAAMPTADLALDALASSESPDRPPAHEPVEDQQARTNDEPEDHAPHLTGPVLAPTPREIVYPAPEVPDQIAAEPAPHTLAGPVLAPTPHTLAAPAAPTEEQSETLRLPDEPEQSHPTGQAVDHAPQTLMVPPLDFRRRLVTPLPPAEAPQDDEAPSQSQDTSGDQQLAVSD